MLYEKIKQIYPELTDTDLVRFIILQDDNDGKGSYIAKWEHPILARPTEDQLK